MSDIPLNIDIPSGTEFTVNKAIRVDSAGRIHTDIAINSPKLSIKEAVLSIKSVDARYDSIFSLPVKEARLLAYEILSLTDSKGGNS